MTQSKKSDTSKDTMKVQNLRVSSRDRILFVVSFLNRARPVSVREIQNELNNEFEVFVDRRIVYKDLHAIEIRFPLEVTFRNNIPHYRLKVPSQSQ